MSTKAQQEEKKQARQESIDYLLKVLGKSHHVYTAIKHVSSSGMTRHISCYAAIKDQYTKHPGIVDITWHVGRVLDYKRNRSNGGLVVGGCGMDMGFHVVYTLSSYMYRGGFRCFGAACQANDHFNDRDCDRAKGKHLHKDGGYALSQSWL